MFFMTVRKRKRKNRYLGQRSHGAGNTKNRRGAGNRGGRGKAGSHKHRFQLFAKTFGTERPQLKAQHETRAINLDMLVQLLPKFAEEKKTEKTAQGTIIDGKKICFDKVLGKSNGLKEKLVLRNLRVSKKAREKILEAEGTIEGLPLEAEKSEGE